MPGEAWPTFSSWIFWAFFFNWRWPFTKENSKIYDRPLRGYWQRLPQGWRRWQWWRRCDRHGWNRWPLRECLSIHGGMVSGYSTSFTGVPLATISSNPSRPSFSADSKALRTQNRDILKAYKDGHIDGRWFEYILPYHNHHFMIS